ncbi:MAG TPA: alkaline phosphatase family protein [Saprospiraceae bacterium]|nr:alkaline phosphatase family protein [Saprospiraceae bacterium]
MKSKELRHNFLSEPLTMTDDGKIDTQNFKVKINRVGALAVYAKVISSKRNASYPHSGEPFTSETKNIPCKLFDPLGKEFTRNKITMDDLDKYRDVDGFIRDWEVVTEKITGIAIKGYTHFESRVRVMVSETIPSSSAPPIINTEVVIKPFKEFEFDLYRLGQLSVRVSHILPLTQIELPSAATIKLIRPDGSVKATLSNGAGSERIPIRPSDLKHSRGANGNIKKWKLRIETAEPGKHKIHAQVYGTHTVKKDVLLERLDYLLGSNGENIVLKADWDNTKGANVFKLLVNDKILAENLDYYGIFDPSKTNDGYKNIDIGIEYNIGQALLGKGNNHLRLRNFTLDSIVIGMGLSEKRESPKFEFDLGWTGILPEAGEFLFVTVIPPDLPMISFDLDFSNTVDLKLEYLVKGVDILKNIDGVKINKVKLEVAFDVNDSGDLKCRSWIKLDTPAPTAIDYLLQAIINSYFISDLDDILSDKVESIIANMLGGLFELTNTRWDNAALKIDYIADMVHENKPSIGYLPSKGFASPGPGMISPKLKNTWKSPLLTDDPDKIKHIIVLMMENRSFDHVLGYLSLERPWVDQIAAIDGPGVQNEIPNAINPNIEGLTKQRITDYSDNGNLMRPLKFANFKANEAGLKTQLPVGVGHEMEDVLEQIKDGTMQGFVENFNKIHTVEYLEEQNVHPQDVLGYYTDEELSTYKFLADNFTICDHYFSSFPGATLPNRMFSLTGNLKMDNNGEPITSNSLASPFLTSREQTIFDILSQHDVSWRVYESFPSVTMLRMFSKYAGDHVHIKDIKDLEADIMEPDFPSVVFIEPAMHDMPANDDHPPADMLRGQHFVQDVYNILREKNPDVWNHCLFVITYDEHGGLFDHVAPIVAEVFQDPQKVADRQTDIAGAGSGGSASGHYLKDKPNIYGVRVPTFLVSPYVEAGGVYKEILDHTSILKTILIKFCGKDSAFMSDRVNFAFNLGGALTQPRRNVTARPEDLPVLDEMKYSKSKLLQNMKSFKAMTKADVHDKPFDFHEYMSFLGRMVKPLKK